MLLPIEYSGQCLELCPISYINKDTNSMHSFFERAGGSCNGHAHINQHMKVTRD